MRTLHSHLDVNKDGVISYDDFMLLAERFANLGHLTPEAKEEFQKVLSVSIFKARNLIINLFLQIMRDVIYLFIFYLSGHVGRTMG